MWVIFLASAAVIALVTMLLIWIGNGIYLCIRRANRSFELETKKIEQEDKQ